MKVTFVSVRVSAAMCRLPFTECGPLCIKHNGCSGNCCDAPSRPGGCLVTVHPSERDSVERHGGRVSSNGFLQPNAGKRGCPFKSNGLCSIHFTGDKPFGCIASPFTLNKNRTLIVRNRYKMLPCYKGRGPKAPAYRAFASSLELIFGQDVATKLAIHLDSGGGDISLPMPSRSFRILMENDAAKHSVA